MLGIPHWYQSGKIRALKTFLCVHGGGTFHQTISFKNVVRVDLIKTSN